MSSSQFGGKAMRFSLDCVQSPTVGRKSSEKDRRPLAAVPIAQFRCWEAQGEGTDVELDPNSIRLTNLICQAELCAPVRPPPTSASTSTLASSSILHPAILSSLASGAASSSLRSNLPEDGETEEEVTDPIIPPTSTTINLPKTASSSDAALPLPLQKRNHFKSYQEAPPVSDGSTTDAPIVTTAKLVKPAKVLTPARNIFGNIFVQPSRLMDLSNQLGIFFIFPDLVVRHEGDYSLQFHVFDVCPESDEPSPILASCYSDPFTVYGVRQHPGVPPSTALAKHFVSQGFQMALKKGKEKPGSDSSD